MEIRNIYEDSYGERLYSVLLDEGELSLFSKKSKDEKVALDVDGKKLLVRNAAGLAGAGAIGMTANGITGYKFLFGDKINSKDKKEISEKLLQKARKQGIKIGKTNELSDFYVPGKDIIALRDLKDVDPSALSHELGHAQYMKSGRSKNIIGKAAHSKIAQRISRPFIEQPGKAAVMSASIGTISGIANAKKKAEGKELNLWDKTRAVALPALLASPTLISEAAASRKGIKMLKEAGASKELINQSKKKLRHAFGTYASQASIPIMAGGVGEYAARKSTKVASKSRNSDKED